MLSACPRASYFFRGVAALGHPKMSEQEIAPNEYQPLLLIYVVWHPKFERGQELAESVYAHFSRDSPDELAGIGSQCSSVPRPASETNAACDHVEAAHHTAIIVLVDPQMVVAEGWDKYVEELWSQVGTAQTAIGYFRSPLTTRPIS